MVPPLYHSHDVALVYNVASLKASKYGVTLHVTTVADLVKASADVKSRVAGGGLAVYLCSVQQ